MFASVLKYTVLGLLIWVSGVRAQDTFFERCEMFYSVYGGNAVGILKLDQRRENLVSDNQLITRTYISEGGATLYIPPVNLVGDYMYVDNQLRSITQLRFDGLRVAYHEYTYDAIVNTYLSKNRFPYFSFDFERYVEFILNPVALSKNELCNSPTRYLSMITIQDLNSKKDYDWYYTDKSTFVLVSKDSNLVLVYKDDGTRLLTVFYFYDENRVSLDTVLHIVANYQ